MQGKVRNHCIAKKQVGKKQVWRRREVQKGWRRKAEEEESRGRVARLKELQAFPFRDAVEV